MASTSPGNGVLLPSNPDAKAQIWANETQGGVMPFSMGQCLSFVRQALGLPGGEATALDAWNDDQKSNAAYAYDSSNPPPAGVPIFWSGPNGDGHVVLSAGNGMCYSTDIGGSGGVYYTSVAKVSAWLGQQPAGWSNMLESQIIQPAGGMPAVTTVASSSSSAGANSSLLGVSIPGSATVKSWVDRLGWFLGGGILLIIVLWHLGGQ